MKTTRRLITIGWATWGCWLMSPGPATPMGAATLCAQTVQLPTYRVFQMPLNVIVPDGAAAVVGGTKSSAASQTSRGLPLLGPVSRSRTRSHGSNSVSVSATIIDHRQWDAAMLTGAARGRPERPTPPEQLAAERMTQQIRVARPEGQSVDALAAKAQQDMRSTQSRKEAEALELIRHGNECLAKGQRGAARIFFRTAMRQSNGKAHQLAQQRLAILARR